MLFCHIFILIIHISKCGFSLAVYCIIHFVQFRSKKRITQTLDDFFLLLVGLGAPRGVENRWAELAWSIMLMLRHFRVMNDRPPDLILGLCFTHWNEPLAGLLRHFDDMSCFY